MWRVLATHSIRQFPPHFPSRASQCAITFRLDSTQRFEWLLCHLGLLGPEIEGNTKLRTCRELFTQRHSAASQDIWTPSNTSVRTSNLALSRPVLGSTPPPIQWPLSVLSPGVQRERDVKLTIHLHQESRLRMSGVINPPLHMTSQCARDNFICTSDSVLQ
jgi:hypothetical protein